MSSSLTDLNLRCFLNWSLTTGIVVSVLSTAKVFSSGSSSERWVTVLGCLLGVR